MVVACVLELRSRDFRGEKQLRYLPSPGKARRGRWLRAWRAFGAGDKFQVMLGHGGFLAHPGALRGLLGKVLTGAVRDRRLARAVRQLRRIWSSLPCTLPKWRRSSPRP